MISSLILLAAAVAAPAEPPVDWAKVARERGHFGKVEGREIDAFMYYCESAGPGTQILYPAGEAGRRYFLTTNAWQSLSYMVHRKGKALAVWQAPLTMRSDRPVLYGTGTLDAILVRNWSSVVRGPMDATIQKVVDARVGFASYMWQPQNNAYYYWFYDEDGRAVGEGEVAVDEDLGPMDESQWSPYERAGKGKPLPISDAEKAYVAARASKSEGPKR